ncbi:alpha/beta hydrolase [Kibdelosporangium lantanae]
MLKRGMLRIAVAAAAVTLVVSTTAAASTSSPASAAGPKPTIVLVHGAWADASGFGAEITSLTRLGYPVVALANPLRGLTSDSDAIRARLATITGPIVLVGHSYGGAVITNAARGVPNVKSLVYLAAFALDKGESLATALPPDQFPGSHVDPTKLDIVPVPNPAAPGGQDADLYLKPAAFADIFAADVPREQATLQALTQRPLANLAYTEPSGVPAWATIPSWNLVTTDDHAVSPAGQRFMANRMHAHTETVRSAHDVMVSHPQAVVRIILEAACG